MDNITDNYLEHEQHIIAPSGKRNPFWRNMKTCSTCYSEHQRIVGKNERSSLIEPPYEQWQYAIN
jgi:hypothetical protein